MSHVYPFPGSRAVVVRLPGDRATITGTPVEVGELLAALDQSGRLSDLSTPVPTGVPGQVLVNCRVLEVQHVTVRRVRPAPTWPLWVAGSGAVVVAAGAAWVAVEVMDWLLTYWAAVVGGALVVGAALVGLGRVGICVGVHCPGCRHQ